MPVNIEDFDIICEELDELKRKNNELLDEFSKNEYNKSIVILRIFFSIAFVASLCLIIFAADSRDAIMIITGIITASGALYGLFYDEI